MIAGGLTALVTMTCGGPTAPSGTTILPPPPAALPRLAVSTILAFGDSITEGEVPAAGEFHIRPRFVEPDQSYPAVLTTLLAERYTAQGAVRIDAFCDNDPPPPTFSGILVINAGCLGEPAGHPATLSRLATKLSAYHPDVVLLLEGVNDLGGTSSVAPAVQGVQALIAEPRGRGAQVMVGTLLPQIAGSINAGAVNLIVPFNTLLRPVAAGAGAREVDLYADIAADLTDWISPYDGLHPTAAGYQEIARIWFKSLQIAFEMMPASTTVANQPAHAATSGPSPRTPR